jgi:serine/threonine-protein kinase RsbT
MVEIEETTRQIRVSGEHHVAVVRQMARNLAELAGMSRTSAYGVATCAAELASNLVFHSTDGGIIAILTNRQGNTIVCELISEDDGPGIPDVELAQVDGFTTHNGLGGGLPSMERLMGEVEITSAVGVGTRIKTRKTETCRSE